MTCPHALRRHPFGALALGVLLSLSACGDAPPPHAIGSPRQMSVAPQKHQQPIVAGAAAPSESAVFFLEVTTPSGVATCTATLVTPDLLLTAAHCVTGQFGAVDCGATELGSPLALDAFRLSNEPDLTGAPEPDWRFFELSEVRVVFEGAPLCGRDVALLRLAEPLSEDIALPLDVPRAGLADAQTSPPLYQSVGYGAVHPSGTGERVRRISEALEVACNSPDSCENFVIPGAAGATAASVPSIEAGEWVGEASGCPGDSGGPALMQTRSGPQIVGVLSRGRSDCSLNVYTSPQSEDFRAAIRDMIQIDDSAPIYEIPSWVLEPEPPTPPDFMGGNGGAGGEPMSPPPEMGGTAVDNPAAEEPPRNFESEESGCSCRVSGPTEKKSGPAVALFLSFLFWLGARRRSVGARAEVRS